MFTQGYKQGMYTDAEMTNLPSPCVALFQWTFEPQFLFWSPGFDSTEKCVYMGPAATTPRHHWTFARTKYKRYIIPVCVFNPTCWKGDCRTLFRNDDIRAAGQNMMVHTSRHGNVHSEDGKNIASYSFFPQLSCGLQGLPYQPIRFIRFDRG